MGIAIFSPPLDSHGNSVKGVKFCQELLKLYPFGVFDTLAASASLPKAAGRASRLGRCASETASALLSPASAPTSPTSGAGNFFFARDFVDPSIYHLLLRRRVSGAPPPLRLASPSRKLRLAVQLKGRRALRVFVRLHRSLLAVGKKYAPGGSSYDPSIQELFVSATAGPLRAASKYAPASFMFDCRICSMYVFRLC